MVTLIILSQHFNTENISSGTLTMSFQKANVFTEGYVLKIENSVMNKHTFCIHVNVSFLFSF